MGTALYDAVDGDVVCMIIIADHIVVERRIWFVLVPGVKTGTSC